jgi:hypothetical protein
MLEDRECRYRRRCDTDTDADAGTEADAIKLVWEGLDYMRVRFQFRVSDATIDR